MMLYDVYYRPSAASPWRLDECNLGQSPSPAAADLFEQEDETGLVSEACARTGWAPVGVAS